MGYPLTESFFFTLKLAPLRGTMWSFFGSDTVRIQEAVMSLVVDRHSDLSPSSWKNAGTRGGSAVPRR